MSKRQFSDHDIVEGTHNIEFYFAKDEREFRLTIRAGATCSYVKIEEQNDNGCILHVCGGKDADTYHTLDATSTDIFHAIRKFTNDLMNTI